MSRHAPGRENYLRILLNLEHAILHPVITRTYATVAAPRIDNHRAGRFTSVEIGVDGSMCELENSMGSVKGARQAELNQGL